MGGSWDSSTETHDGVGVVAYDLTGENVWLNAAPSHQLGFGPMVYKWVKNLLSITTTFSLATSAPATRCAERRDRLVEARPFELSDDLLSRGSPGGESVVVDTLCT